LHDDKKGHLAYIFEVQERARSLARSRVFVRRRAGMQSKTKEYCVMQPAELNADISNQHNDVSRFFLLRLFYRSFLRIVFDLEDNDALNAHKSSAIYIFNP